MRGKNLPQWAPRVPCKYSCCYSIITVHISHIHHFSLGVEKVFFLFFTCICWLLSASLFLKPYLNTATAFAFDLHLVYKDFVFVVIPGCRALPGHLLRHEAGRKPTLPVSSTALLPHPVFLRSLVNCRCIQGGPCLGQAKGNDPSLWNDLWEGGWTEGWITQQGKVSWNLAVSRFLLAVILVSGFETAMHNHLLTVWVGGCWCRGIISPTKFPPNPLSGIVSKKNKEKKWHRYLLPQKFW